MLVDIHKIPQAYIVGRSLGSTSAVDFAPANPEATRSLFPIDTSALGGYPWSSELAAWFAPISAAAEHGDIESAKERRRKQLVQLESVCHCERQ